MSWSSTARAAAAAEHGRQNAARYARQRQAGSTVAGLVAAAVLVALVWDPSWTRSVAAVAVWVAVVAASGVALWLLIAAGRRVRSVRGPSYRVRVPRRYR